MASPDPPLVLHDDRLLPADPPVRAVARRLYDAVRELPIISPHGHVDPRVLLDNEPFRDPASLFVTPDHYVTRLLHASGVPLESLGVAAAPLPEPEARAVWRQLCSHWAVFRGTPMRYWLDAELGEIFDVSVRPSAATADTIYDQIAERLRLPEYLPRSLYERFGISVLATTDDPCSDLSAHAALTADGTWSGRVIPTFRPDRYLDHGATSADHSNEDVRTDPLDAGEAEQIYAAALAGAASLAEAVALRRHMLLEMARMSCDDGLVMTLHPAVRRDHHRSTAEKFGADVGADIPLRVEFTDALRPLLERFG